MFCYKGFFARMEPACDAKVLKAMGADQSKNDAVSAVLTLNAVGDE
jgi:hypothetical protein